MNTTSAYPICDRVINTTWVPAIMEYILGVIGNIIALVLLWINRRDHQWKSFYKLLTGLALTDLIGVFLIYPFVTARYVSHFTWCFPKPLCQFVSFIFMDAHISSAMLICAMSIDRYVTLRHPPWIQPERHEGRKYTIVLIVIWVAGSLISMLHLVGVGDSELFYPGSWCYFDFISDTTGNRAMSYIYSVFGFFIVLVTILANILTCCRIRCPNTGDIILNTGPFPVSKDAHLVSFIIAATIVSFISWMPLLGDVLWHAVGLRRKADESVDLWMFHIVVLNSIVDPFLYIVLRQVSFHQIVRLYQYCFCRRNDNAAPGENESGRLINNIGSPETGTNTPVYASCISDNKV